jgi:hypothetical protein
MSSGSPARAPWRGAGAVVLLLLVGCSHAPTEPVRGTQQRGQQVGPLHGAPQVESFVELNLAPPPYPTDSNLIEFKLRGLTTNRFFIDGSSLTVEKDRVVRFVLVIRTIENVKNVSFSGLRCSDREWKDYAFARDDRTWVPDKDASWRRIQDLNFNAYQRTLYEDYFCVGGVLSTEPVGDAVKLVKLLKNPTQPDPRVPRRQ